MTGERANYKCPSCSSLAIFREVGRIFVCLDCKTTTLESRLSGRTVVA